MKILLVSVIVFLYFTFYGLSAEEGMPQLNPEFWPSQVFWLIITFTLLYIVTWKFILPKITNNLEDRKAKIVDDLNEAQKFKEETEIRLTEYKKIIQQSKQDAEKIYSDGRKKLENDIANKRKKIEKEIEQEISNLERNIYKFKISSVEHVEKIVTEISSEVTKKIIGKEVNSSNVSAIAKDISKKNLEKYL